MAVSLDSPSFALIDGSLCKLNRRGTIVKRHAPLGGVVAEFHVHQGRLYVREDADGFLAGMPNLYCLDENLFITWLAEMPSALDPYAAILGFVETGVRCQTREGIQVCLSFSSGRRSLSQAPMPTELVSGLSAP